MAPAENCMPELDVPKHSFLSRETGPIAHKASSYDQSPLMDQRLKGRPPNMIPKNQRPDTKRSPRNDSIIAAMCQWTVEHQIGLSINLLLLHALTHLCFPRARKSTRKGFRLSYYIPESGQFAVGWDDIYVVSYSIIVLTGLRAATMGYVLEPLAQLAGIVQRKDKVRFAEQAWVLIYDSTFWSFGMYIMYNHEHWMNFRELWTGWPNRELAGSMKWYYLVQFAFWVQQILVVNIEERRNDHWQMVSHHIITCVLMITSYGYHQTKVGNTILCLMDTVDIILALAKILKYLQFQLACDIAFGVFMLVWVITRHILYSLVVWSVYKDASLAIRPGCYHGGPHNLTGPFEPIDNCYHLIEPFRDPKGLICWNHNILMGFVYTLLALQVLLLLWFGMIVRVALKVLRGGEAGDSRSDDEAEEDGEGLAAEPSISENRKYKHTIGLLPLEEEVGFEAINLSNQKHSPSRRFRKGGSAASGVNLHSDRKELLGRIGCDKGA